MGEVEGEVGEKGMNKGLIGVILGRTDAYFGARGMVSGIRRVNWEGVELK